MKTKMEANEKRSWYSIPAEVELQQQKQRRHARVHEVSAKFAQVFGSFRRFGDVFGAVRTFPDAFGHVQMRSEAFGSVRTLSNFLKILDVFGLVSRLCQIPAKPVTKCELRQRR